MNFIEKNGLYIKLKKELNPEADAALLKKKNPNSPLLQSRLIDSERRNKEILMALLDLVSYDEIVENRKKYKQGEEKQEAQDGSKPDTLENKLGQMSKKELIAEYGEELEISKKSSKSDIIAAVVGHTKKNDSELNDQGTDQEQSPPNEEETQQEPTDPSQEPDQNQETDQ
jgi:hypothetical protein